MAEEFLDRGSYDDSELVTDKRLLPLTLLGDARDTSMSGGITASTDPTAVPYVGELRLFEEQLEEAIEAGQSRKVATDRVVGASLLDEDFSTLYQQGSMSIRTLLRFIRRLHSKFEPGKPLEIPIVNGTPYGLGVEIEVPPGFDATDFEEMVTECWPEAEGYSWADIKNQITTSGFQALLAAGKGVIMLGLIKGYAAVFLPGLKRTYKIHEGHAGIRLISTEHGNYIDITSGTTSYETTLEIAETVATYLDRTLSNPTPEGEQGAVDLETDSE